MIKKVTNFIKDNLPYLILLMMVSGLYYGYFNDVQYLKSFITPVLILMIYPMMININVGEVFTNLSNPKPIILSLLINFIFSPFVAYLLGKIFLGSFHQLLTGLIIISLIPTSGMTAPWTGLAKGNIKSSLTMISVNLLISILIIPVYVKVFIGEMIAINMMFIIKSLLKVVVVPLLLGDLTRRFIIEKYGMEKYKEVKPELGGVSALGVIIIVFVAMALKSKTILGDLKLVIVSIIPLLIFYTLILIISNKIGQKLPNNGNKIAFVYSTVMRNLTLALGLTINTFGGLAVFIIALAYVVQVPIGAFYMNYLKTVK